MRSCLRKKQNAIPAKLVKYKLRAPQPRSYILDHNVTTAWYLNAWRRIWVNPEFSIVAELEREPSPAPPAPAPAPPAPPLQPCSLSLSCISCL